MILKYFRASWESFELFWNLCDSQAQIFKNLFAWQSEIISIFPPKFPFEPADNAWPLCRNTKGILILSAIYSTLSCSLFVPMGLAQNTTKVQHRLHDILDVKTYWATATLAKLYQCQSSLSNIPEPVSKEVYHSIIYSVCDFFLKKAHYN